VPSPLPISGKGASHCEVILYATDFQCTVYETSQDYDPAEVQESGLKLIALRLVSSIAGHVHMLAECIAAFYTETLIIEKTLEKHL
jgi:hypothetical protein